MATKAFAWSWSRLKNWRACPKRHWEIDIKKNFKEEEGEALLWGNRFHDAMAKRIERNQPLPKGMEPHEAMPARIRKMFEDGADVRVELKLAMTEQMEPCEWFDPRTWFRGVVDVLVLAFHVKQALAIDWKTGGKIQPEFEQLSLNAQLLFAHHPEIEKVNTMYHWSAFLDVPPDIKTYTRADMGPMWTKLLPEVRQMEEAHRTTTYEPRPSGLCIAYCPVTSCPYHGKGSR